jgi:hypothetical protein
LPVSVSNTQRHGYPAARLRWPGILTRHEAIIEGAF